MKQITQRDMELSNKNIELEYCALRNTIADVVRGYVKLFEPTKVYLSIQNKSPFNEFIKEVKGQAMAYNFGVIASIYDIGKDEYTARACYWKSDKLESKNIVIKKEDATIEAYISYPKDIFNGLIRTVENWGHLDNMLYLGRPLLFNKY